MFRQYWVAVLLSLSLFACGGSTNSSSGNAGGGSGGSGGGGGTNPGGGGGNPGGGGTTSSCAGGGVSELGILIQFTEPVDCVFSLAEAAAGISIPYAVVVEQEVTDVIPNQQVSCDTPGAHNLYLFEKISGGNESYCVCDTGLCPEPPATPVVVGAGTYPAVFDWDGKNWFGPSDTGNPKGPPFPPGEYTLHVSTKGEHAGQPFESSSDLKIELTP